LFVGWDGLAGAPLTDSTASNRGARLSFSTVISFASPAGGTSGPSISHDGAEGTSSLSCDSTNSLIDVNDGFTVGREPCTLGESGFLRVASWVLRCFIALVLKSPLLPFST